MNHHQNCSAGRGRDAAVPTFGAAYQRQLTHLQGLADSIPTQRVSSETGEDGCCCCSADILYYGYPTQSLAAGGDLSLIRYSPSDDSDAVTAITLPQGRWLITYSVNASAANPNCMASNPACTSTVGIAPRINGTAFPRGGSFATLRSEGSATLSSSFVVNLTGETNRVGFFNTGKLTTTYQLLNITVTPA